MITLENPAVLEQPLATLRPPERAAANIQPLVSENREHLGDSPSFSSDFQTLPPCGHLLPRVFLPAAPPYLLSRGASPRSRDVQHRDGTAAVAASSLLLLFDRANPTPNPLIPFQPSR